MKKLAVLLAALLVVSLVSGCGLFSKTLETDKGSVTLTDKGLEVKDKESGSTSQVNVGDDKGEGTSLPSDYPQDLVPVYDGAKITGAMRNEDANKKVNFLVYYTVDKPAKDVYDFYLDALKDITEMQKNEINGLFNISGFKADNRVEVNVATEEQDGKKQAVVTINIAPK